MEEGGSEFLTPTTDRVQAKFANLASGFLGKEKADKITSMVLNLDKVGNIRQLIRQLG